MKLKMEELEHVGVDPETGEGIFKKVSLEGNN
jgi:hypothetical protein